MYQEKTKNMLQCMRIRRTAPCFYIINFIFLKVWSFLPRVINILFFIDSTKKYSMFRNLVVLPLLFVKYFYTKQVINLICYSDIYFIHWIQNLLRWNNIYNTISFFLTRLDTKNCLINISLKQRSWWNFI